MLDHFRDSLRFYGDALGLKIFRKHLGWYVEGARRPQPRRRAAPHVRDYVRSAGRPMWKPH